MPVIIRGKQGGTRQLLKGGQSYKTTYTLQSQVYGCVTCNVWIVCLYHKGERGKHGIQYLAYAVYKNELPRSKLRGIKPPLAYSHGPASLAGRRLVYLVDGLHAHLRTTPTGRLGDAVAYSLFHCLAA